MAILDGGVSAGSVATDEGTDGCHGMTTYKKRDVGGRGGGLRGEAEPEEI